MKKIWFLLAAAAFATGAILPAAAGYRTVEMRGGTVAAAPGRAVALAAVSTNTTGTVTVKRITPLSITWTDWYEAPVTNWTDAVEYLPRNVVVTNFATNVVSGVTNVFTNVVLKAMSVPVTSRVARVSYERRATKAVFSRELTNDVCSLTLANGAGTTNLTGVTLLPGDRLSATGSAFGRGRAYLTVEE